MAALDVDAACLDIGKAPVKRCTRRSVRESVIPRPLVSAPVQREGTGRWRRGSSSPRDQQDAADEEPEEAAEPSHRSGGRKWTSSSRKVTVGSLVADRAARAEASASAERLHDEFQHLIGGCTRSGCL
jgi:hypothetical protein